MVSLYNAVGGLNFYNFVSNQYYAFVPVAMIDTNFADGKHMKQWLEDSGTVTGAAFPSANQRTGALSTHTYFYFPAVASTPTENETCTGACTSSNYRFYTRWNYNRYSPMMNSASSYCYVNTADSGGSNQIGFGLGGAYNDGGEFMDTVGFGVASDTTLVTCGIRWNGGTLTRGKLESYQEDAQNGILYFNTCIWGWMHDGVYPAPPVLETDRYNNAYVLRHRYDHNDGPSYLGHYNCETPKVKATTQYHNCDRQEYFDISCTTGSYSAGLFLTDLVIHENFQTNNIYAARGKVDNRVVCLGRGNFELGKIYRATNIFGRTGDEDWICVGPMYPSSRTFPNWVPGYGDGPFHVWKPGELDYMMVRIYTEAD